MYNHTLMLCHIKQPTNKFSLSYRTLSFTSAVWHFKTELKNKMILKIKIFDSKASTGICMKQWPNLANTYWFLQLYSQLITHWVSQLDVRFGDIVYSSDIDFGLDRCRFLVMSLFRTEVNLFWNLAYSLQFLIW